MAVSYGFLSTYSPTRCGLATFAGALFRQLTVAADRGFSGVVQVVEEPTRQGGPDVVAHLVAGSRLSMLSTADTLNRYDVVIVQHEYGIYGGDDGDEVLAVLARLRVPTIVVLHTVPVAPSPHQRYVLERIGEAADALVVMSESAARRLLDGYLVDPPKVVVIPHGATGPVALVKQVAAGVPAAPYRWEPTRQDRLAARRQIILSWGLLGPGKGIEWGIAAMARLRDIKPSPRYIVAGHTHPKVLARSGETYRSGLLARATMSGVGEMVEFDPEFREADSLMRLIRRADVVLMPYDSGEQVGSGVLIEAIAALRPVVATRFPHACELLAGGAGILVPHRDPSAIADALRRVLTEPRTAEWMSAQAAVLAPDLRWPVVADRYRALGRRLLAARVASPLAAASHVAAP